MLVQQGPVLYCLPAGRVPSPPTWVMLALDQHRMRTFPKPTAGVTITAIHFSLTLLGPGLAVRDCQCHFC
jgi:hypothetical protein